MTETVQGKSRERFLVLFELIEQDQELAAALQRESREEADRDSWSCLGNRFLVLFENRTLLKCTFGTFEGEFILK